MRILRSVSVAVGLVVAWAVLAALSSVLFLLATITLVRRCPQLGTLCPPEPPSWPELGVVIAASNEAETIEPALRSLLAQDYPSLEIVVVDDRSTDRTGTIVDHLAASDARISRVHVRELPAGWLGKVHALQRGVERVRGDFVLFTDADIHFAPGALRRAVAWAEAQRLDHLAVLAEVRLRSFWVGVCLASALRSLLLLARPWQATDPRSSRAIGTGAFNLVRRSAFERTPGFEWLRLEVADDIGLGLMMKRGGGRPGLVLGVGQVRHDSYRTFSEAVRGLEKNGFAQAARFSPWRGLGLVALAPVGFLGPFVAFLPVGVPWLWVVGAGGLLAFAAASIVSARAFRAPIACVLLSMPLGDLLMTYIVARAMVLGLRRGGLVWRGTTYPTELLREGQRVEM
jgi:glycosyltransferase involved in cell wall biosynthesis